MKDTLCTEEAFCHAMEHHGDAVYRLALCRTQSVQDAEDIYQDVFLRLLRNQEHFVDDEHLKAWLIRVTINCSTSLHRKLWKRRKAVPLEQVAELTATENDDYTALWDAIGALPEALRIVVHLFYCEGYDTETISTLTGCRPTTVRTRLHRARQQLKMTLEGSNYDEPLSEATTENQGI